MAMAAPDLMEWLPMSECLKPTVPSPMVRAAARRELTTLFPEISKVLFSSQKMLIKDAVEAEDVESIIQRSAIAHDCSVLLWR